MGDVKVGDGGLWGVRLVKAGRLRWQRKVFTVPDWLNGMEVIVHDYCGAGVDVFRCEYDIGNMRRPLRGPLLLQMDHDGGNQRECRPTRIP